MRNQRTFSPGDWDRQGRAQEANTDRRELRHLWQLLRAGAALDDGLGVDQMSHALMVAEYACRSGAGDELVAVALLHDVAKPLCLVNHPAVAAEILRPRLSRLGYDLIRCHSLFLGEVLGRGVDPVADVPDDDGFRSAARQLAEWDAAAVDPAGPRMPVGEAFRRLCVLYGVEEAGSCR